MINVAASQKKQVNVEPVKENLYKAPSQMMKMSECQPYEVPSQMMKMTECQPYEVPSQMMMTECQAYGPLPNKP